MKQSKEKISVLAIVIIMLIRSAISFAQFNLKYTLDREYKEYVVKILQIEKQEETKSVYLVGLEKADKGNYTYKDKFLLNVYEDSKFEEGDILKIKGKIVIPEKMNNPYEFDYKRYLNSKGIYGNINLKEFNIIDENKKHNVIYKVKEKIKMNIQNSLDKKYSSLLQSMLYGDTSSLDSNISEMFSNIGISHMLSVSGSNLAIVLVLLNKLLDKLRLKDKLKITIQIVVVILFALITNLEYSIIRASFCFILTSMFKLCEKQIKPITSLAIVALITFCINPYCVFNLSMQLSYLATLSIILFNKKISSRLTKKINIKKRKNRKLTKVLNNVVSYFIECSSVTLSAHIFTLPVIISSFNSISLLLIPSNILINLFSIPVMFIGVVAIIFSFFPTVSIFLFKLTNPFIVTILKCAQILSNININLKIPSQPIFIYLAYYILILLIIYINKYVIRKKEVKLKNKKVYVKTSLYVKAICVFIFITLVVITNIYLIYFESYIYFLNVGQGNTVFFKYKNVKGVIDAGSLNESVALNAIDNYLEKIAIKTLDFIAISHFDKDHISSIVEIIEKYEVNTVIYSKPLEVNKAYNEIINVINAKKINSYIVKKGDKITFKEVVLRILSPFENCTIQDKSTNNSNSIVLQIEVKDKKFLFMGDATIATEKVLLEKQNLEKVDLVMIGHHGSKDATSEKFIESIKPNTAIISSKKSVYGHPSDRVLEVLKKYKITTYITEDNGAIKIKI
ncbi:MAG: DNA internalization-related competence protein ComEC/Rec2 [Clostridia bacterium]|nr:DNA internalization-related competence protein ComEC/Rec2 [Clostridia bacterium]